MGAIFQGTYRIEDLYPASNHVGTERFAIENGKAVLYIHQPAHGESVYRRPIDESDTCYWQRRALAARLRNPARYCC
jgi:hypothetical protein